MTRAAQREMIIPSLIPIVVTVIVGVLSEKALGGLLIGVIVVGLFFAVMMTSGGGAWDNAREADRGRRVRRQGLGGARRLGHQRNRSATGSRTQAGPAINPMIKVANIVAS